MIPTQTASIEISPFLWVRWCLEGDQNQIADLIRAVLAILGVEPRRSSRLTGTDQPFGEQGYSPTAGRGALTEALHAAVALSREGQEIRGLGLIADCPIGRLRVPLVFDGDVDRSTVVLFATETGLDHEFRRSLDMLALSTWGQNPWRLLQPNDVLSQRATDLSIYQDPDSGVRAALVAARFCQSDPAQNARWFVVLTQTLFGLTLNGRPDSLPLVEQLLWDHLRDGGESRWGDLYDDRDALLTLLMSYVGEVLIKRYGGRWGNDRVSGRRFGPTSGLEVADMRYNLGAAVLKSFYQGDEAPMLPGILEYARRAHEQNPTAVD